MTYIRFSLMKPATGNEERVVALLARLNDLAVQHEGCLEAYSLFANDGTGTVARLAIYTDEDAAEHTALDDSVLAVRSELHSLVLPGHEEHGLFTDRQ